MKKVGIHGGDIYRNNVEMDFSVNINPLGIPEGVRAALQEAVLNCTCYPDPEAERLTEAISEMTGAPRQRILCGSGASELFVAIVHACKPARAVLPAPSFLGYEKAVQVEKAEVISYWMREAEGFCIREDILEVLTDRVDLLFLANPNNPVGRMTEPGLLLRILEHCKKQDILVVLDECFIELAGKETESWVNRIEDFPNLIVVRAFTKSFAIPGVRLGYLASSDPVLLANIKNQLPEWNLSVFAQRAGAAAARERSYLEESVRLLEREREFLTQGLKDCGFRVYPSEVNFILFQARSDLGTRLLEQKILIRDCSNFKGLGKGFFRVAVKTRTENEALLAAVKACQKGEEHGAD